MEQPKMSYYQRNRDAILQQRKSYYENNKDKRKTYYENNKEKILARENQYYKNEDGKKRKTINAWKRMGLVADDYEALYDLRKNAEKCWVCEKAFQPDDKRCLDHDHETGKFRQILCYSCNVRDNWKNKVSK